MVPSARADGQLEHAMKFGKPNNAVAEYHTHPNTGGGWGLGLPSPQDFDSTVRFGVVGYIVNGSGIIRVNPWQKGDYCYVQ